MFLPLFFTLAWLTMTTHSMDLTLSTQTKSVQALFEYAQKHYKSKRIGTPLKIKIKEVGLPFPTNSLTFVPATTPDLIPESELSHFFTHNETIIYNKPWYRSHPTPQLKNGQLENFTYWNTWLHGIPTPERMRIPTDLTNDWSQGFMTSDGNVMGEMSNISTSIDALKNVIHITKKVTDENIMYEAPFFNPQRAYSDDTDVARQTLAALILKYGMAAVILANEEKSNHPLVIPISEPIRCISKLNVQKTKSVLNNLQQASALHSPLQSAPPVYLEVELTDGEILRQLYNRIKNASKAPSKQKKRPEEIGLIIDNKVEPPTADPELTQVHDLLYGQNSKMLPRAKNPFYYKYFLAYALYLKKDANKETDRNDMIAWKDNENHIKKELY